MTILKIKKYLKNNLIDFHEMLVRIGHPDIWAIKIVIVLISSPDELDDPTCSCKMHCL